MHYVARYEPNYDDFIPPSLMEAALMSRVKEPYAFSSWFSTFFPTLPENILKPVSVIDKSDSKLIHFDGLNLSRAWCFRVIARKLKEGFAGQGLVDQIKTAADVHLKEGLKNVVSGEYGGEHWLGTFAMLALYEQ